MLWTTSLLVLLLSRRDLVNLSDLTVGPVFRVVGPAILAFVTGLAPRLIELATREVFSGLMRRLEIGVIRPLVFKDTFGVIRPTAELRALLYVLAVASLVLGEFTITSVRRNDVLGELGRGEAAGSLLLILILELPPVRLESAAMPRGARLRR